MDSEQNLDLSIYANLIKEVDLNHDGFVDLKEFRDMMASLVG
jgi:EF hand.